jgi:tetratricopeptide (TPR) repeat protein
VAWGIAAWSLGRLAFDSGYNTYRNPYPAPPVQTQRTVINYTQPLSVVASREEPEPEEEALTSQEKSTAAIERARGEFGSGDYLSALKSTDESISWAAGDSALHEFRALCLFALGRYGDAAGVLNPVLASGPGWDWSTMAAFYPDSDSYTGQLRKLESYVEANPNSADSHFLLGYHYMVAGFIDQAYGMFDRVVTLQPADTVAAQLRNLAESSSPDAGGEAPSPEDLAAAAAPDPNVTVEPVDPSDLEGGWKASSADGKAINLSLGADGKFTWNYDGANATVLAGDWSIDEEGQLVLATDDVQMVADISLDGDNLKFVLDGAPVGDPGLSFQRQ